MFVPYEEQVLELLALPHLGGAVLKEAITHGRLVDETHTGVGYLLTIRHPALAAERVVLDQPPVHGTESGIMLGFVVFIEDHELTLECFSYEEPVPADIRTRGVVITKDDPQT
ncbi:MAG: hypothetical protein ACFCU2_02410 [Acidimicrobiia bacterium]